MDEPTAERIDLPEGYGTTKRTMDWAAVRERLEQAPRYWLVTSRRDGRAHVVPVDGGGSTTPGGTAAARPRSTSATWSTTSGSWSISRTPWPR